jgi:hypothetical protein
VYGQVGSGTDVEIDADNVVAFGYALDGTAVVFGGTSVTFTLLVATASLLSCGYDLTTEPLAAALLLPCRINDAWHVS